MRGDKEEGRGIGREGGREEERKREIDRESERERENVNWVRKKKERKLN